MLPNELNHTEFIVSFGEWLRRRRESLRLTRRELADRAGCSVSTLRKIEDDERRPSSSVAESLARALTIVPAQQTRFVEAARGQRRVEDLGAPEPSPAPDASPAPNLPAPSTALVGRSAEIANILNLLRQPTCRLITITGPGGMGKTRLALSVAAQAAALYPDGLFFAPLAALAETAFVAPTLAQILGLADGAGQDRRTQLIAALQDRRCLIILDNLEHLPDVADLVADLLRNAPLLTILATSRTRLQLLGEWSVEVAGLPLPPADHVELPMLLSYDAPRLFVEAARRAHSSFTLADSDAAAIVHICRLVEGMPLALELAAAWVAILSPAQIAEEIRRSLDFLAAPLRDLPPRHRSLRVVFDHSWQLLGDEERAILRRLSIFHGTFTRETAEAVAGATLPLLASLIAASLLRRSTGDRYDLHELVRQYAAEQLTAEEVDVLGVRLVDFCLGMAEAAAPRLTGPDQARWLDHLQVEIDLLRAALRYTLNSGELERGLRLTLALARFWQVRGYTAEGYGWLADLLAATGDGLPSRLVAKSYLTAGRLAHQAVDRETAHEWYLRSFEQFRCQGDAAGEASALLGLGDVTLDHSQARDLYQRALDLAQQASDVIGVADALFSLASLASGRGDYAEADELYDEALIRFRQLGDPLAESSTLRAMAIGAFRLGILDRAEAIYQQALSIYQTLGTPQGISVSLNDLGDVALAQGDSSAATDLYRQSLRHAWQVHYHYLVAWGLESLAQCAATSSDGDRAVRLSARADRLFTAIGARLRPDDRQDREDRLARLRNELGPSNFDALWSQGAALSLEEAYRYAMGEDEA
ncbi:MAG: tetratricopeptide repeat protein [Caldilineaceae bacterium]|nr:tetratricopeptide repeat protein [Caldilineaceae bacterium]